MASVYPLTLAQLKQRVAAFFNILCVEKNMKSPLLREYVDTTFSAHHDDGPATEGGLDSFVGQWEGLLKILGPELSIEIFTTIAEIDADQKGARCWSFGRVNSKFGVRDTVSYRLSRVLTKPRC